MNAYHLEIAVGVKVETSDDFESTFDAIADALAECDGVLNADVAADTREHILTFEMDVESEREVEALEQALAAVRTALHASGGSTAGWDDQFRMLRQTVEVPTDEQARLAQA